MRKPVLSKLVLCWSPKLHKWLCWQQGALSSLLHLWHLTVGREGTHGMCNTCTEGLLALGTAKDACSTFTLLHAVILQAGSSVLGGDVWTGSTLTYSGAGTWGKWRPNDYSLRSLPLSLLETVKQLELSQERGGKSLSLQDVLSSAFSVIFLPHQKH